MNDDLAVLYSAPKIGPTCEETALRSEPTAEPARYAGAAAPRRAGGRDADGGAERSHTPGLLRRRQERAGDRPRVAPRPPGHPRGPRRRPAPPAPLPAAEAQAAAGPRCRRGDHRRLADGGPDRAAQATPHRQTDPRPTRGGARLCR